MLQFSFKDRIAFNYIAITALLIFVVFFTIYTIVKQNVYSHIDNDIIVEIKNHLDEINVKNGTLTLIDVEEWNEREHNTVDVNPVFVQFLDLNGKIIEKSPNLKSETLVFHSQKENFEFFNAKLLKNIIRQIQVPIYVENKKIGSLIIAMSLTDSTMVLDNLFYILVVAFPLILILLFFIARFFAGRSIKPINTIIETSNSITKDNLKTRIPLPGNRDELYILSKTINSLLDRIENTLEKEKQFTSDASHELRTPLTIIKGTLEVLIRKPRGNKEYEEKINSCISEVDRLNTLVDQLLLLARFENKDPDLKKEKVYLNALILDTISRHSNTIQSKKIHLSTKFQKDYCLDTDPYLLTIILNNLISNALKYSKQDGKLDIIVTDVLNEIECQIIDYGIGIPSEDIQKVFNQFFRSHAELHPEIKGIGLGLSIVKKISLLLNIPISVSSKLNEGTTVKLVFYKNPAN
ncbi:HAMP domain-containing histidine kinase [Flavobacterium sp. LS1R47]|jgi:signal transduction histidine kinase|uniref:histidine kinase n=1 Tax=Flavobacterium frigoritolerans TaxID=2987686 RepID=A0A9X3HMC5_9FLAO|nr:HAMP domain-containing sensor histidine kinase [Flavobacterium frigoritolerans]MCV9933834.1 HAMP domain-containing histidine kinase [Flavobacterium frigoritolerans]